MNMLTLKKRQFAKLLVLALWAWTAPIICQTQVLADDKAGTAADSATAHTSDSMQMPSDDEELTMPAGQIIQVMRNNPEVMVEVKSLVAAAAQQQGVSVQSDALTDEQVYAQIESSKELRASITQFLRARGYVTEGEIQEAREHARQDPTRGALRSRDMQSADELSRRYGGLRTLDDDSIQNSRSELPFEPQENAVQRDTVERETESKERASNVTDEPDALHQPSPYNLLSLRDLYTQVPDSTERLKRFGSDLFVYRKAQGGQAFGPERTAAIGALDVPLGPDYVLGPGDELSINLWGGISQNLLRMIDREGRVALPEAGLIQVAGLTMAKAEAVIGDALQAQYRNARVAVTVSRVRSVRIFVVGDVQRPGSYEVSALASPISALFAAGGPTAVGSLRIVRHYRNEKLLGEIDLYDFMLHGVHPGDDRLQGGDTLLVPPAGPQVAIFGAVRRPAIYQLKDEKDLAAVLEDAGGLTVAAALAHITIDRVVANQRREEISVLSERQDESSTSSVALQATEVKDGDRVHVGAVLPYNERAIYVQGHVARPGKIAYRENMQIGDVLRSYKDLLPEPAENGEIVRMVAPDLHPETINFNVPDVLIGNSNIALQPFDTIRVFGRYEQDAPTVSIRGEVQRPGTYALFEGMTAAQLVRTAGGFKRAALVEKADLASYQVVNGARVSVQRRDIAIGDAVSRNDQSSDAVLKPGDVLTIHQLTGWNDIGASIILEGEVAHPGSYGFQEGEHLSDILRRAGGFRSTAYPEGAVLTRPEVATLQEKSRLELIRQIESSSASARLGPGAGGNEQAAALQLIQQQQEQVLAKLRSQPATGRLVIHINAAMETWAGTAADIEVRSGDVLRIPKRPGFVLVSGQVYNASALTFIPEKTAAWYLQRAGGATAIANRKEIFVVRVNGDVIGRRSGTWYERDVLSTRLNAGDTIVVPQKIIGPSVMWRNLLGTAQVAASLAIAAAVAGL